MPLFTWQNWFEQPRTLSHCCLVMTMPMLCLEDSQSVTSTWETDSSDVTLALEDNQSVQLGMETRCIHAVVGK